MTARAFGSALFPLNTERDRCNDFLRLELARVHSRLCAGSVTPTTLGLNSLRAELKCFDAVRLGHEFKETLLAHGWDVLNDPQALAVLYIAPPRGFNEPQACITNGETDGEDMTSWPTSWKVTGGFPSRRRPRLNYNSVGPTPLELVTPSRKHG